MKMNEGNVDRIVRVVFGAIFLSFAFWGPQTEWAYLGLVPLITGIWGVCPLYSVIGFSTRPLRAKEPFLK